MICRFVSSTTKNINMKELKSYNAGLEKDLQAKFEVF